MCTYVQIMHVKILTIFNKKYALNGSNSTFAASFLQKCFGNLLNVSHWFMVIFKVF